MVHNNYDNKVKVKISLFNLDLGYITNTYRLSYCLKKSNRYWCEKTFVEKKPARNRYLFFSKTDSLLV